MKRSRYDDSSRFVPCPTCMWSQYRYGLTAHKWRNRGSMRVILHRLRGKNNIYRDQPLWRLVPVKRKKNHFQIILVGKKDRDHAKAHGYVFTSTFATSEATCITSHAHHMRAFERTLTNASPNGAPTLTNGLTSILILQVWSDRP